MTEGNQRILMELRCVCERYRGKGYYVCNLPPEALNQVFLSLHIPVEECIIAFADTTAPGGEALPKSGLAICGSGLYWRNEREPSTRQNHLPWYDLAEVELSADDHLIAMGSGGVLHTEGLGMRPKDMLSLLRKLQHLVWAYPDVFSPPEGWEPPPPPAVVASPLTELDQLKSLQAAMEEKSKAIVQIHEIKKALEKPQDAYQEPVDSIGTGCGLGLVGAAIAYGAVAVYTVIFQFVWSLFGGSDFWARIYFYICWPFDHFISLFWGSPLAEWKDVNIWLHGAKSFVGMLVIFTILCELYVVLISIPQALQGNEERARQHEERMEAWEEAARESQPQLEAWEARKEELEKEIEGNDILVAKYKNEWVVRKLMGYMADKRAKDVTSALNLHIAEERENERAQNLLAIRKAGDSNSGSAPKSYANYTCGDCRNAHYTGGYPPFVCTARFFHAPTPYSKACERFEAKR